MSFLEVCCELNIFFKKKEISEVPEAFIMGCGCESISDQLSARDALLRDSPETLSLVPSAVH